MEKLKLIVSTPQIMGGVNFSEYLNQIEQAKMAGHKICEIEYLHGKVESEMGYDTCACLNAEICGDFKNECYKDGIYDAEVIDYPNPCKAYLWNNSDNKPRGLIVDINDEESIKYAEEQYKQKSYWL